MEQRTGYAYYEGRKSKKWGKSFIEVILACSLVHCAEIKPKVWQTISVCGSRCIIGWKSSRPEAFSSFYTDLCSSNKQEH